MALFRSGPQLKGPQLVAPMYQGIIDAEKQKGMAMREAMGAFGQAISPKAIGMRKFRQEFAGKDMTDPKVLSSAASFLMEFDPNAAMQFANLAKQYTPTAEKDEWVTTTIVEDGREKRVRMNKRTGDVVSLGGEGKPLDSAAKTEYVKIETVGADGKPVTKYMTKEEAAKTGTFAKPPVGKEDEYVKIETVDAQGKPITKYMTKAEAAKTGTFAKPVDAKEVKLSTAEILIDGVKTKIQYDPLKYKAGDPSTYTVIGATEEVGLTTDQWTGMDLQNEGIQVEDLTAMYDIELTPSGRPIVKGKVSGTGTEATTPSALSKQVTEAFGHTAGSAEHKKEMQTLLSKRNTIKQVASPVEQINMIKDAVEKDPTYKTAQERITMVGDAKAIIPLVKQGSAKATAILERLGSDINNSGIKAVAEMQRFISAGSWSQNLQDWVNKGFQGTPSDVTLDEIEELVVTMENQINSRIHGILDLQRNVYMPAMEDDASKQLLENTIQQYRPPAEPATIDITANRVKAASQPPAGTPDGVYVDANGNQIEVINGVAYDL